MKRTRLWALALLLAAALTFPPQARAQDGHWLRAESPTFIVYSTSTESRLLGVVEDLESFDALLRRMTNAPAERSPTRLEVYLFTGSGQLAEAYPGMGTSVRGVYQARPDIIASLAVYRDVQGLDAQDILFHEYAHHFMYQYFANAYPAWYVEGFAEFVATAAFEDNRIVLGRAAANRAGWLSSGSWLPMSRIISASPWQLRDGEEVAKFYAQSWLFTHYLFTQNKMEQFRAYVRALRLGAAPEDAFEQGFGMTPEEMQSALRSYLAHSPSAMALTRPAAVEHAAVEIVHMPASADLLLPITTRVRRASAEGDDAAALLSRVRAMAGDGSRDDFTLLVLARAEAVFGDTARARSLLEPYVTAHPNDAEAQTIIGESYLRDARGAKDDAAAAVPFYAQARRAFGRAHRIDENYVPALYGYAEAYEGADVDDATAENLMNVLLLAHQLAPQVDDISLYTARALMFRNRPRDAIPMLRAMAHDPHGSNVELAQQLLTEAETALASQSAPAPH